MYSFGLHPTNSIDSGHTKINQLKLEFCKHNKHFDVNENSAITYVVQYG
jgi:hypothetical protein